MIFWLLALLPLQSFVSGDAFRSYADHVYVENAPFDPSLVAERQTLFVRAMYLQSFFSQIHPTIQHPYILITHDADDPIPGPFRAYLDDPRLIAWFGINYDGAPHPKMHPIPIGVANAYLPHGRIAAIQNIQENPPPKKHLAYSNFTIQSFSSERWPLFKQLADVPFCYRTLRQDFDTYLKTTASSKFMISPRGLGLDTYRLWESLYLGTIPVVKSSSLDGLYEGLPILIISDWKEVTESFLEEQFKQFSRRTFSMEKLSMEYWICLINQHKKAL